MALLTAVLTDSDTGAQNTEQGLSSWGQDLKLGSPAQEVLFRSCQGQNIWESYGELTNYLGPGLVK